MTDKGLDHLILFNFLMGIILIIAGIIFNIIGVNIKGYDNFPIALICGGFISSIVFGFLVIGGIVDKK